MFLKNPFGEVTIKYVCMYYLKLTWLEKLKALKLSILLRQERMSSLDYGQHHDSTDSYMARIGAGMSVEFARHKLINMALDLI